MDAVAVLQTVQTVLSAVQSGSTSLNISEVLAATNATLPSSAGASASFSPFQLDESNKRFFDSEFNLDFSMLHYCDPEAFAKF